MTRPAQVTQAAICRAIRAAKQTGAGSVSLLPDGTVRIDLHPPSNGPPADLASKWDDVPTPPPPRRRIGEKIHGGDDPLSVALARWQRGEINKDQLPPGRYPNGMRVYADGEWEAEVSASPLRRRERVALEAYVKAKGMIGYVKGGGLLATERLAARGYVEIVQSRPGGRIPYYGITPAGEAEWMRQTSQMVQP